MRTLDEFKGKAFYWEARRLQEEQRRRSADKLQQPAKVVSLDEYRRRRPANGGDHDKAG